MPIALGGFAVVKAVIIPVAKFGSSKGLDGRERRGVTRACSGETNAEESGRANLEEEQGSASHCCCVTKRLISSRQKNYGIRMTFRPPEFCRFARGENKTNNDFVYVRGIGAKPTSKQARA